MENVENDTTVENVCPFNTHLFLFSRCIFPISTLDLISERCLSSSFAQTRDITLLAEKIGNNLQIQNEQIIPFKMGYHCDEEICAKYGLKTISELIAFSHAYPVGNIFYRKCSSFLFIHNI